MIESSKSILLVEDNPGDARLVRELLREVEPTWSEFEHVGRLDDALTRAEEDEFGLVLLDLGLPDAQGLESLNRMRRAAADLPIIVLTGLDDTEIATEAVRGGAQDYLVKGSFDGEQLSRAMRYAVERFRIERELVRETERFRELFEGTLDAVLIADDDRRYVEANPAACELLGRSREEILGMKVDSIIDDDLDVERLWERFLQEGVLEGELRIRRPDGERRSVDYRARANYIPGHHLSSLRDITERKRAQASLKESEERLRAAQKMEAVGQLAGGIAHDFNNLMTVVTGHSDLILESADTPDELLEDVRQIKEAGERASDLTRKLLAFARKRVLEAEILDLSEVVSEMEEMLDRLIREEIRLRSTLEAEAEIEADRGSIEQVIVNLAVNASDAMPEGGELLVRTSDVDLEVPHADSCGNFVPAGRYVELSVSDSGIGMDESTQGQVFDPFFTTKDVDEGTGLGLSTVYGIVRQLDGFIWLYSEPDQGTTFKIYLPRQDGEGRPASAEERESGRPMDGGDACVLVVEDEDAVRRIAVRGLEQAGYSVIDAGLPEEALDLARERIDEIQVVVTDVTMPQMSGYELVEEIRELRPEMEALFTSGYVSEKIDAERRGSPDDAPSTAGSAAAGSGSNGAGDRFLEKPFSPRQLARTVGEILNRSAGDPPGPEAGSRRTPERSSRPRR